MVKAPLASATAWTVKNNLNRYLDKTYDLWFLNFPFLSPYILKIYNTTTKILKVIVSK